jgi:hypothetical protein
LRRNTWKASFLRVPLGAAARGSVAPVVLAFARYRSMGLPASNLSALHVAASRLFWYGQQQPKQFTAFIVPTASIYLLVRCYQNDFRREAVNKCLAIRFSDRISLFIKHPANNHILKSMETIIFTNKSLFGTATST